MTVAIAYTRCEKIARKSATNFYPAFLLLPRAQRRAMYALYAFTRFVDDICDVPGIKPWSKRMLLDEWRVGLDAVLDGRAKCPIRSALRDAVERFHIPREHLHAVIEGCRLDLDPQPFATFADLQHYCRLVASAVGQACIHIWGFHGERAKEYADAAGIALQLTNILRDLGEDRALNRTYLPLEDFERFGCDPVTICKNAHDPHFQALMRFEVARARHFYDQAGALTACLDPAGRAVFFVMLGTYRRLLDRIEAADFDVFTQRVSVPRYEKLGLMIRALPVRWGWAGG